MRRPWAKQADTRTTSKLQAARETADTVADYKHWVAQASALDAARADQVTDPQSNPDTVAHLRSRARQTSLAEIDGDYEARMHELSVARRHRRIDTEAAESELDYRLSERDEATRRIGRIRAARASADPATAAAEMTRLGQSYMRRYLALAWVASALAAVGICASAYLSGWGIPASAAAGIGGELTLTFLVTQIISGRAELNRRAGLARDHEGTRLAVEAPQWAQWLPWGGVAGLLLASIAINTHGLFTGTGILGALGALGAAVATLCTLLAWGYSVEASATTATLLSDSSIQAGEDALDEVAAGGRIPRPDQGGVDRDSVLEAIAADSTLLDEVLAEVTDRAVAQMPAPRTPREHDLDDAVEIDRGGDVAVDTDTDSQAAPAPLREGAQRAAARGANNRSRVIEARNTIAASGAKPSVSAIARATGLDRRTVRRHLDA